MTNRAENRERQGCRVSLPWVAVAVLWLLGGWAAAQAPLPEPGTWPTLHRDPQRSGYTPEVVRGPYERKWFCDFHDEMIATRVEAIVAEGRCFVGVFHAVRLADGEGAWRFPAGGMILKPASLSADGQSIVFGSEDMHAAGRDE
jgi:hypothetical protein